MALDKLHIEEKVDNETKRKLLDSGLVAEDETLSANEVNKIVDKVNELVDGYNFGTPITGFNFKENVATYADLLAIDPETLEVNDGFGVLADGLIYVWNGSAFAAEGNGIDLGLKAKGKVEEGDERAVSGEEVYINTLTKSESLSGFNQYDYTKDIDGFYIDYTTGILTPSSTSSVSEVISVSSQYIYIKNRLGNAGFLFFDIEGNRLKPLNLDGVESSLFESLLNGGIKVPENAVSYQFTTKFVGVTNRENTKVKDTDYDVIHLKKELIPVTDFEYETRIMSSDNKSVLAEINGDPIPNRVNSRENTISPDVFSKVTETINGFGIEIVEDLDSPTKDYLGFKRVFTNTLTPNDQSNYRIARIDISSRPSKVSIGFWVKKTQLQNIFLTSFFTYLGLSSCTFINYRRIFNGETIFATPSEFPVEYSMMKASMRQTYSMGEWVRIEICFFEIEWNSSFSGSTIDYYFLFNRGLSFGKSLETSDWTILFNSNVDGNVLYGDPNGAYSSNVITLKGIQKEIENINNRVDNLKINSPLSLEITESKLYIGNKYNSEFDFVRRLSINRKSTFSNNPNVNFDNEYLCLKNGDLKNSVLLIKASGDDITPANLNGSYIGGNHSWTQGRNVVSNAHGKTIADVGSVYKNSTNVEFVLLRIVDENNLWMISKNQGEGHSYSFTNPTGTLVFVNNGDSTSDIVVNSSASLGNTYTTITESFFKVIIDNDLEVSGNGRYSANNVKIIEEYYGIDFPSIIADIISNRPLGGYTTQPQLNSFDSTKLIKHSIVYEVQETGCMLITTSFRTYNKKVDFNFHGFIQAGPLASGDIYVPKSLPYVSGAKTYNLNLIEDWTAAPSTAINLTPEYWADSQSPPDRVLNLNSNSIFHTGYLTDRGVGLGRKDKVNNSMFLNTTRKIYPMGYSVSGVLDENTSMTCVAFRDFQDPENNPIGRTSITRFEIGNEYFVYLDYHNSLIDLIDIPAKYMGRKIKVYEKVGNIVLMTDVVTGSIEVQSTVSYGDYGFIILKIQ